MLQQMIEFDRALFLAMNNGLAHPFNDLFFGFFTLLGFAGVLLPLTALFLFLYHPKSFLWNMAVVLCGILVGAALLHTLKEIVARPRPLSDFWNLQEKGEVVVHTLFQKLVGNNSFPSGHAQLAFGTAVGLARIYPAGTLFFLLIASLIGISRIYVGAHFPLDVLMGALLGSGASLLVFRMAKNLRFNEARQNNRF